MNGPDVKGASERRESRDLNRMITSVTQLVQKMDNQMRTTTSGVLSNTADFFKQQGGNVAEMTHKILLKSNTTLNNILKANKDLLKKTGAGLLNGLGGLLTIGGLAGYLLTGKQQFLNSMIKGLVKWSPLKHLTKAFDGAIVKMAKPIGGIFSKVFSSIMGGGASFGKKLIGVFKNSSIGKFLGEAVDGLKILGEVIGGSGIGKIFDNLSGVFGKIGKVKGIGKILGKFAGKSGMKRIPVLGSILGVTFGIQRFSKGDIVGGLLELSSGAAGFLDLVAPGAGFALGMAIDGLLMFRDIKGIGAQKAGSEKKPAKTENRLFAGLKTIGEGMGMFFGGDPVNGTKMVLLSLADVFPKSIGFVESVFPVIDFAADVAKWTGGVMKSAGKYTIKAVTDNPIVNGLKMAWESTTKFIEDPIGGLESFVSAVDYFVPGTAKILDPIIGGIVWTANKAKSIASKASGAIKSGVAKIASIFGADAAATNRTESIKTTLRGDPPPSAGLGATPKNFPLSSVSSVLNNVMQTPAEMMPSVMGLKFANDKVDISGVEPTLWHNFTGMVNEYNKATGNTVQLNSAYRSLSDQKALFASAKPGYAAPPGRSLHNYGYAVDINSKEANDMESLGLMKKWGFHRPISAKEPWHVEPSGIDRLAVRNGALPTVDTPSAQTSVGDAYAIKPTKISTGRINQVLANSSNMPKAGINSVTASGVARVSLDDYSINRLAEEISKIATANVPQMRQHQTINVDARG